jgi:hypothetical protein
MVHHFGCAAVVLAQQLAADIRDGMTVAEMRIKMADTDRGLMIAAVAALPPDVLARINGKTEIPEPAPIATCVTICCPCGRELI